MGIRNNFADICKDDEYNSTESKSSDEVLWWTNGRILIWWPLVRATMHASVNAAPFENENLVSRMSKNEREPVPERTDKTQWSTIAECCPHSCWTSLSVYCSPRMFRSNRQIRRSRMLCWELWKGWLAWPFFYSNDVTVSGIRTFPMLDEFQF